MRTFFILVAVLSGVLSGVFTTLAITAGQVSRIHLVIHSGESVQIIGVTEAPDRRIITFTKEGAVYTASYRKGCELLVGEEYFLTSGGHLMPIKYRAK